MQQEQDLQSFQELKSWKGKEKKAEWMVRLFITVESSCGR